VAFIMSWREGEGEGRPGEALGRLAGFRRELYWCLGMRRDALFESCDALACRQERLLMLAELCLEPECRRGHGGVYDALNRGEVRTGRLRRALAGLPLPAWDDGRIRLVVTRAKTDRVYAPRWIAVEMAAARSLRTSPDRSHGTGKGGTKEVLIIGPGWRPSCPSRSCPDPVRSELVRVNLDDRRRAIDFHA
jgi:DDE superfamily endonuclease